MYNSVYIRELEQHVHRFLWRNVETDRAPDIYVITAVNMGEPPCLTIAASALRKTAVMGENIFPKTVEIILNSTYVDDVVDSVENVEEAHKITNDICCLLQPGDFYIKGWIISGHPQSTVNLCNVGTQKVLGVSWNPVLDTIQFNINLNFPIISVSEGGGCDSGEDETENKIPNLLSKRIVLSQLNGIYDPLGLLVPFTIKGKLLMRNLWAKHLDWDTPLSGEERSKWFSFLRRCWKYVRIFPSTNQALECFQ